MMKDQPKKKLQKIGTALGTVCLTLLFLLLLAGWGRTAPENPMENGEADASRMYLTSSTLAMDQEELAHVENANIHSGETGDSQEQPEEEQEESEEEPQETQAAQAEEPDNPEPETQAAQQENASQPQDTPQSQPEEGQQPETDLPDTTAPDHPISDSLLSLIQKNQAGSGSGGGETPGGEGPGSGVEEGGSQNPGSGSGEEPGNTPGDIPSGGGQETTLDPGSSAALFTTSIVDGETVTQPDYFFTITLTERGKQLTLVSQNVTVNGLTSPFSNGDSVRLQEGANFLSVTLRFRDGNYNQIDAPSQTYTVYYIPESHYLLIVTNTKTGEVYEDGSENTVYDQDLALRVVAKKGNTDIDQVRLRINNTTVSPQSDGIYRTSLQNGSNTLRVTAGSGQNQQVLSCTVYYQSEEFKLTFESAALTETISGYRFGGYTNVNWESESTDFAFRVSCSMPTGTESLDSVQVTTRYGTTEMRDLTGADGYIHITLDASDSGNTIFVQCTDSQGERKTYTWYVQYKRLISEEENAKNAPKIDFSLENGETVPDSPYLARLTVSDHNGNKLYPSNFQLYLNGKLVEYTYINGGYYEYLLNLTEGANTVHIDAVDNEQYTASRDVTVYFSPSDTTLNVRFIFSAEVVGLGTMIDETVSVPSGYTVAQVVEERLAAYGYSTIHQGTPTTPDYFLNHVQKAGILSGWSISESEREWLAMEGISIAEPPASLDSLGELDFTASSGWMVTLNAYYIGSSMGNYAVRNGDEIHVLFTLDNGKDISVNPDLSPYG